MRRFWTLLLTPVLALGFFLVASPAANALGSEVLGCDWGTGWVANNCGGGYGIVTYSAHNLSGTYSYSWTVKNNLGNTISNACNGVTWPCIYSGCTTTSSSCALDTSYGFHDHVYTASLKLTQSGQSRTITAQATGLADPPCRTC